MSAGITIDDETAARLLLEQYERPMKLALAAASQGANAVAELLTFAQDGPLGAHQNFTDEPVEKLADALKLTLEIELAWHDRYQCGDQEYVGALNRLLGTVSNFLEDWAG